MTLAEFLTARLDEDAQVARSMNLGGTGFTLSVTGGPTVYTVERALADVAAKRRIVELHRPVTFTNTDLGIHNATVCFVCHGRMDYPDDADGEDWDYPLVQLPWPCPTILALTQVYRDHPDFDPSWGSDG